MYMHTVLCFSLDRLSGCGSIGSCEMDDTEIRDSGKFRTLGYKNTLS